MKQTWSLMLLVFLSFGPALPCYGQDKSRGKLSPKRASAVDRAVNAELTKQQAVGVAIGIIQNGEIVYLKGYGFADRDKKIPVSTTTVFNWASNSKPLTAVAAMQLVEKKLLDLDEDVRTYVPEFPDKGSKITVRHILCHQSGIPHYANGKVIPTIRKYPADKPFLDPVTALDRFNQSPLLFTPGKRVDYSSYAYLLLSAVVQRAGKQPFDEQIRDRIAKPLGLRSLQLDLDYTGQPDWATGYVQTKDKRIRPAAEDAHYWVHGAGGYKSNVADFARWAKGVVNQELLSADSFKQMWTTQKTTDGKPTDWGLGFTLSNQGGLKVSHNGLHREVTTRMVLYPQQREGVVVMCNCDFVKPAEISTAIFSALNER